MIAKIHQKWKEKGKEKQLKVQNHKMGEKWRAPEYNRRLWWGWRRGGGGMGAESQTAGRLGSSGIAQDSRFHLIGVYVERSWT